MANDILIISSTGFESSTGRYLDESGKRPVHISMYGCETRLQLDGEACAHLKTLDERYKGKALQVGATK